MAETLLRTPPKRLVDEGGNTTGLVLTPDDFERLPELAEDAHWEERVSERRAEQTVPAVEVWAELGLDP